MSATIENIIEDVALRLPDLPEQAPKNLFDILGVRNKESINSRVLAYFLNVNETHGLQSLFFDSLKTIIESKKYGDAEFLDSFNGAFNVLTENTTTYAKSQTKKRIDLSLIGRDKWGIIIENKLYHNLVNPLRAYWEHTQKECGDTIIGIILTLFPTKEEKIQVTANNKKVTYLNITHKEWMDQVQNQLNVGEIRNIEGLLYLKEYIKTIESHYSSKMDEPIYNALTGAIIKHRKEIKEIQDKVSETIKYLDKQTAEVFESFGYEKTGSWYTNTELLYPCFFYIPSASEILEKNKLWFTFEVRNKVNTALRRADKVSEIKSHFSKLFGHHKQLSIGGKSVKQHTHIAICRIDNVISNDSDYKSVFTNALNKYFMKEKGLVNETQQFLEGLSIMSTE